MRLPEHGVGPKQWRGYVSDEILAPLALAQDDLASNLEGAVQLSIAKDRSLVLRYGTSAGKGVVGNGSLRRRTDTPEGFFVIDIDSFWSSPAEETPEFVVSSVLKLLDELHEPTRRIFLKCIQEKFKVEIASRVPSA